MGLLISRTEGCAIENLPISQRIMWKPDRPYWKLETLDVIEKNS